MSHQIEHSFDREENRLKEDDEAMTTSFLNIDAKVSEEEEDTLLSSLHSTDTIKSNSSNSGFSLRARRAIEDYWTRRQLLDSDFDILADDKKE